MDYKRTRGWFCPAAGCELARTGPLPAPTGARHPQRPKVGWGDAYLAAALHAKPSSIRSWLTRRSGTCDWGRRVEAFTLVSRRFGDVPPIGCHLTDIGPFILWASARG